MTKRRNEMNRIESVTTDMLNWITVSEAIRDRFSRSREGYRFHQDICGRFSNHKSIEISYAEFRMLIKSGFNRKIYEDLISDTHSNLRIRNLTYNVQEKRNISAGIMGEIPIYVNAVIGIDLESRCNWLFLTYSGLSRNVNETKKPEQIKGTLYRLPFDPTLKYSKRVEKLSNEFFNMVIINVFESLVTENIYSIKFTDGVNKLFQERDRIRREYENEYHSLSATVNDEKTYPVRAGNIIINMTEDDLRRSGFPVPDETSNNLSKPIDDGDEW